MRSARWSFKIGLPTSSMKTYSHRRISKGQRTRLSKMSPTPSPDSSPTWIHDFVRSLKRWMTKHMWTMAGGAAGGGRGGGGGGAAGGGGGPTRGGTGGGGS